MKKVNIKNWMRPAKILMLCAVLANVSIGYGQVSEAEIKSNSTPDKVASKLGTLQFEDGMPDAATTQKLYDELDYIRGVDAFINGFPLVSLYAIRKGMKDIGVNDNEVILMSGLMNSKSRFLTGNADTYYFFSFIDLTQGPVVVETPPGALGIFDDMWWKWVSDFGLPGADRGEGGKYVILPPGYKGAVPEGGYFVRQSNTWQVVMLGRSFLENNDPKPVDELVKRTLKIYPYVPGGLGSGVGNYLNGSGPLGLLSKPVTPKFVEGTGKVMNTIPPNDYSYFEMLNEAIQLQPVEAADPEILGSCAAIGIVKGKPFNPDARMKKILTDAAAVANAASRAVIFNPRESEGFKYYAGDSKWYSPLWVGGYNFMTPPPEITKDGIKAYPNDGAIKLNSRIAFFYFATGITPAMCMRLENLGSQYLIGAHDTKGNYFDGGKTYKVTLPANIPAARFWSFTVYDNQSRSMLETSQLYPRAGSQSYPSPAAMANADGSTTIYMGPKQPDGVDRGNWIQTTSGKGWFTLFRIYSPLKPFFDKSWKLGEIEEVK